MNCKAKLEAHVSLTTSGNRDVIFCRRTGNFFGLNASSSFLLRELLRSDLNQASELGANHFGVPIEQIRSDLQELVKKMEGMNLLRIEEQKISA